MRHRSIGARSLCALACLLFLGAWQLTPRSQDLSGISGNGAIWQDVTSFFVSPDGKRAVFVADKASNTRTELYSVPVTGGTPLRINPTLASGEKVWPYDLDVSSERVVFQVNSGSSMGKLYSAPIDGSQPPTFLAMGWVGAAITPDGTRVVYTDSNGHLRSIAIDASAPATLLAENPPIGFFADFLPTATGRVLYKVDDELSSDGIFSVPVDGSESPVQLPIPSLLSYGIEQSCELTPDGVDAVFLSEGDLYRVPVDGSSASVQLNPAMVAGGNSDWYELTPDGTRVVYRADQDTDGTLELYSVPFAGGPSVKLSGPLPPGGYVTSWTIAPDGERVVFKADTDGDGNPQLFSVQSAGGSPVEFDAAAGVAVQVTGYKISPDGDLVAFLSDAETVGDFTLHVVPIDGSAPPTVVADPGVLVEFRFTPGGDQLVFATDGDGVYDSFVGEPVELYAVPVDGSAGPVRLSPPPVSGGSVRHVLPTSPDLPRYFRFAPGGQRLVYLADQERDETIELYSSTLPHVPRARPGH